MESACSTEQGVRESQSGLCSTSGTGKPGEVRCPGCGQTSCPDPYQCGMATWACSFFQAMKAVQVDILKAKIQKAWGPMMDKAADGIVQSMGTCWQSIVAQAKAKEDFKELLRTLWTQGQK